MSDQSADARSDIPWLLAELRAARAELADTKADYLRRHKDACNCWLENQRLRAVVDAARKRLEDLKTFVVHIADSLDPVFPKSAATIRSHLAALDATEGKQT